MGSSHLFDVYPLLPVKIVRGEGSRVWSDTGTEYLDMYSGHAVISIGHSHPHWVERIEKQLRNLAFYSNSVHLPLQEELADLLCAVSGKKDYRLFLSNSGAEANENALKLASFHNGRRTVLAFKKSFHGRTSLAVSATDNPAILAPVNNGHDVVFAPLNDIPALEKAFAEHDFTAVIVEGIQGVGGIRPAEPEFLQAIRRLCDASGAVYIADSVQCGYGRSGQFFTHDIAGVDADIYTMAKGMGNGFPVAGTFIAPHFEAKHGMLGTTFGGNPLACAAALAVLEIIQREDLINQAATVGNNLLDELQQLPQVSAIRGRGLMIGFEMQPEFPAIRKDLLERTHTFTGEAKGGVIRLLPALNLSMDDAQLFINNLKTCLNL